MSEVMARTLDATVYAVRRDSFVDVAQRLIQAKGYEQTSIQDVLDEVGASRGAFYHYFDSKAALLDAVVERMVEAATGSVEPLIDDPSLTAVEKLEGVLAGIARWKGDRSELVLAVLRVWLADDNAIVRDKVRRGITDRFTPMLTSIITQGVAEGTFTVTDPSHGARVVVALFQGANEIGVELYFARQADAVSFAYVERRLAAFQEALERILGVPAGSLRVTDPATLHRWLD
jgi:AcrR family transcriptional regulator